MMGCFSPFMGWRPCRLVWGLVILIAACCQGCGSGEYERRLNDQVGSLGQQSPFSQLTPAQEMPGGYSVRLPDQMQRLPDQTDRRRLMPPAAKEMPGRVVTLEATVQAGEKSKQFYYCYVLAIDVPPQLRKSRTAHLHYVKKYIQDRLGAQTVDWTKTTCTTAGQRTAEWQKIRHTRPQEFYYIDKDGKESYVNVNAVEEFWTPAEIDSDKILVIYWRVPETLEKKPYASLPERAPLVAGAVAVKK